MASTREDIIRYGMDPYERERFGLKLPEGWRSISDGDFRYENGQLVLKP